MTIVANINPRELVAYSVALPVNIASALGASRLSISHLSDSAPFARLVFIWDSDRANGFTIPQ
jgi:hypothetical protein